MLPFSAEYPATIAVQFPSNNPPCLPNVQVLPEAQSMLPFAASAIANEVGIYSSQSPARMFCYNMLSSNGWSNSAYAEVIKLACDAAVLKTRMGAASNPAALLVDAVREVLTLYTSMLVLSYPELSSIMTPPQVQAASTNHGIYQDLLNQIANMYAQTVQYQPPHTAARHAPVPNQVGNLRPAIGQQRGQFGGAQPLTNKAVSGIYQGTTPAQPPAQERKRYPTSKSVVTATKEEPVDLPDNFLRGEIENMDRETHSIVYFGKKFDIPTAPLRRRLEETVEIHEALAQQEEAISTPYINSEWLADTSLDDLIATHMAQHYAANNGNFGAYIGYGLVVTPIISQINLAPLFIQLAKSATFSDVARVLIEYPEKITDKDQLRYTLSAISQIDRLLTKLLNDFLENMVDYHGLTTTSFIEDGRGLPQYLNERFKGKYNNAYTTFQRKVMEHLFQHTRAEGKEGDEVSQISDYGSGVFWDNVVVSYSITFITASSQELGYNVTAIGKEINSKTTPLLRRLMDAVQKSHDKTVTVSHHLTVTSDDARYGIFSVNGDFAQFNIKEI